MCFWKIHLRSNDIAQFISCNIFVEFRNSFFEGTSHRGCFHEVVNIYFFINLIVQCLSLAIFSLSLGTVFSKEHLAVAASKNDHPSRHEMSLRDPKQIFIESDISGTSQKHLIRNDLFLTSLESLKQVSKEMPIL